MTYYRHPLAHLRTSARIKAQAEAAQAKRTAAQHTARVRAEHLIEDYEAAVLAANKEPGAAYVLEIGYDNRGWYRFKHIKRNPLREAQVIQLTAALYAEAHAKELEE